jgi:hypothetical protein
MIRWQGNCILALIKNGRELFVVASKSATCGAYAVPGSGPHQPGDRLRAKVADQQQAVDIMLRELADDIELPLIEVPKGLTTAQRVEWSSAQLRDMGAPPALA